MPYGRQSIEESDIDAVADVLRSAWLTTGPKVEAFEEAFSERVDAKGAASCSNGTAALHLAALALGIGPGDHVIVPAVTFLATANAIRFVGGDVIFADVNPDTGLMMPEHVEQALEQSGDKRIKAIFPVHLNGQTGDPEGLAEVAKRQDLRIVEDACHALGTTYLSGNQQHTVGSCAHADMATFSFHPVKTIATGEGGMVTSANSDLIERTRLLRSHGLSRDPASFTNRDMAFDNGEPNPWYYEMHDFGFNYRLTDMQCALGLSQLSRLDEALEKRRKLVGCYQRLLKGLAPNIRPIAETPGCVQGWHLFVALIDFESIGKSRAAVMRALADEGIGSQVHYIPLHKQPYYRELYGDMELRGSEKYYSQCLSLPLFPKMEEDDVEFVVAQLSELVS